MKNLLIASIILLCLVQSACSSSKQSTATNAVVKTEAVSTETSKYAVAKSIYDAKCTTCHNAKKIQHYDDEQWKKIMVPMAVKARLTDTETQAVLEYVLDTNEQ